MISEAQLVEHRPVVLRLCYRMLGSWAEAEDVAHDTLERAWRARDSYRGTAPLQRWLLTIATNACLNAAQKKGRSLPRLESAPGADDAPLGEREPARWVTPAADAALFPDPSHAAEARETVALAFVALLQRLPPKQRATLLLKDVLGWAAEDIAAELDLSLSAVNSALHRARQTVAPAAEPASDAPLPSTLSDFVSAWEQHDLDRLVRLLHTDVELEMPPWPLWLKGRAHVARFFGSERFAPVWAAGLRATVTHANGQPALVFFRAGSPHAVMVLRFSGQLLARLTVFIGPENFAGFAQF